jgi:hypothetical protein
MVEPIQGRASYHAGPSGDNKITSCLGRPQAFEGLPQCLREEPYRVEDTARRQRRAGGVTYDEATSGVVEHVELRCFPSRNTVFVVRVRDLLQQLDRSEFSADALAGSTWIPGAAACRRDEVDSIGHEEVAAFVSSHIGGPVLPDDPVRPRVDDDDA